LITDRCVQFRHLGGIKKRIAGRRLPVEQQTLHPFKRCGVREVVGKIVELPRIGLQIDDSNGFSVIYIRSNQQKDRNFFRSALLTAEKIHVNYVKLLQ
jgi:hypothetical protein